MEEELDGDELLDYLEDEELEEFDENEQKAAAKERLKMLIERSKLMLENLAVKKNPFSGEALADGEIMNHDRIAKMCGYTAEYFGRCLEENGIGDTYVCAYKTAKYKNETNAVAQAAKNFSILSRGRNPFDNTAVGESDLLKNGKMINFVSFVAEQLKAARIEKRPFSLTDGELEEFMYSDEPIDVAEIERRVDGMIDKDIFCGISAGMITSYLIDLNFMEEIAEDGEIRRIPTVIGEKLGITVIGDQILCNTRMQQIIVRNIPTMLKKYSGRSQDNIRK